MTKEEMVQFALKNDDTVENTMWKIYEQGRADERKKIMEIVDGADDIAQAMYLLGQYIISEELKEKNVEEDM